MDKLNLSQKNIVEYKELVEIGVIVKEEKMKESYYTIKDCE